MPLCHGQGVRASPIDLPLPQQANPTAVASPGLLGLGVTQGGLPSVGLQPTNGLLSGLDALGGGQLAASAALSAAGLLDPLQQQVAALQAQQQLAAQAAAAEQLLPLLNLSNLLAMQGLSVGEVADLLALKQALQSNGRPCGNGHGTGPLNNPLYKTELCRSWEETGTCRYGAKCQFAHGREELRPVQRHPKYKTEICRTFAATGICPYGTRCRFIHSSTLMAKIAASAPPPPAAIATAALTYSAPSTPVQLTESPLGGAVDAAAFCPSPPPPAMSSPLPLGASSSLALTGLLSPGNPSANMGTAAAAAMLLAPAATGPATICPGTPSAPPSCLIPAGLAPIGTTCSPDSGLGLSSLGSASTASLQAASSQLGSGPATPKAERGSDQAVRRSLSESGLATTPGGSRRLPIFSALVEEERQQAGLHAAGHAAAT